MTGGRWDSECCENEKWKASADVPSLERGEKQPFYHVLVDSRDWPPDSSDVPVAYVAHDKLYAPEVCLSLLNDSHCLIDVATLCRYANVPCVTSAPVANTIDEPTHAFFPLQLCSPLLPLKT